MKIGVEIGIDLDGEIRDSVAGCKRCGRQPWTGSQAGGVALA